MRRSIARLRAVRDLVYTTAEDEKPFNIAMFAGKTRSGRQSLAARCANVVKSPAVEQPHWFEPLRRRAA